MTSPLGMRARRWLAALLLAAAGAHAQEALPTFAELEAAGARIGEIRVKTRQIFDTEDPKEDKLLFRWANALHVMTRPSVVEEALLFRTGDPVSLAVIEETERVLRSNRYLYDVAIRPLAVHEGVVDVEVETRDTWTLNPGVSAGRSGGANTGGVQLQDYNFLGSGVQVSVGRSHNVDRSSTEFSISDERAFGGWTSLSYSLAQSSDGRRDQASVAHPFYSLDTRWGAGASALRNRRLDPVYVAGEQVAEYRHDERAAEVWAGWSAGREDDRTQRFSGGLDLQDDRYAEEPGSVAPSSLPASEKQLGPFFRWELLEDRFEKLQNRNLIARPEFFALGLQARVQLGWAAEAMGSTRDTLLYQASLSRGFEPTDGDTLVTAASLQGQLAGGRVRRHKTSASMQYYLPQGPHWLFYASAAGDALVHPEPGDELQLGGDNGLRGYPLRYQNGNRRALFTLEERVFSDVYLWRLFRLGAAAFVDVGRAWGGNTANPVAPGWLANAGLGLRVASVRSAFGNVLHLDVATPVNAPAGIKRVQFLVKTKASF